MLQAMIDIGSNTIRMAVYEINDNHTMQVMKRKHTVGLSAYVLDGVMLDLIWKKGTFNKSDPYFPAY